MRSRHPTILEENRATTTLYQDEDVDDVTEITQERSSSDSK
jgi:hypothetical protein